jgi:DNA-binding HxlR family transcriptional regulator
MNPNGPLRTVSDHTSAPVQIPSEHELSYCPVFQHMMELLGRRWTGVILRTLLNGPSRFGDLRKAIPGLSDRLLAERLGELEFEGLVERRVDDEIVTYRLSDRGEDLRSALTEIAEHAERWANQSHLADRPGRRCPGE